jgi:hypothetical protein
MMMMMMMMMMMISFNLKDEDEWLGQQYISSAGCLSSNTSYVSSSN